MSTLIRKQSILNDNNSTRNDILAEGVNVGLYTEEY
jgi:hypothetical protein